MKSPQLTRLLLPLALLSGSCRSNSDFFEPRADYERSRNSETDDVDQELNRAESELDQGANASALERLFEIRDDNDVLSAEERNRLELLIERCAVQLLSELTARNAPPEDFESLFNEEIPKRVRVSAGISAARRLLEEDDPLGAYEMIRTLDEKFTSHHERAAAGDVLAEAGFKLAKSTDTTFFIFEDKTQAPPILEYLTLNYPSNRQCEQAYLTLASLYEEDEEYQAALDRYDDLLLYYRSSPYRAFAFARIPALRLKLISGPDYDRSAIQKTRSELEEWLAINPNHELESSVLESLEIANQLEIDSDLTIATFYQRVDKKFGARLHAHRALQRAIQIGNAERIDRATKILDDVVEDQTYVDPGLEDS